MKFAESFISTSLVRFNLAKKIIKICNQCDCETKKKFSSLTLNFHSMRAAKISNTKERK